MQDSYFDSRLYHIWSPPGRLFGVPGRLFGAPGRLFGVPGRPWGDPGETHNVVAMAQKGSQRCAMITKNHLETNGSRFACRIEKLHHF